MAQSFVTTYRNHYRWHNVPKTLPHNPDKVQYELSGDIWLLDTTVQKPESEVTDESDSDKIEAALRAMLQKRMKTTYQVSYCQPYKTPRSKIEASSHTGVQESQQIVDSTSFTDICKGIYEQKQVKLLPPLTSARTVFGYLRPTRFYVPLTVYQREYGKVALDILMKKCKN